MALPWLLWASHSPSGRDDAAAEIQAADSFQRKIENIEQNAKQANPAPLRTGFPENEINAYFAQRRLKMPDGVKSVRFQLRPGMVTALTRVDFEEITRSRNSWNPLLALFSGVHDAEVVAHAGGNEGLVQVDVDSVTLDGVTIPRAALQLFVEKFVQLKYPSVRLNGRYKLPARIYSAIIGQREGVVTQR